MDEQNSIRILTLVGEILTHSPTDINIIMKNHELTIGQKLDAIAELVDSIQPDVQRQANSVLMAQDFILRHRVLQIAVTFLLRSPQLGASRITLNAMETALRNYETYVAADNTELSNVSLERAQDLYQELRSNITKFVKRAEKNFAMTSELSRSELTSDRISNEAQQINASQKPYVFTNEQDFNQLDVPELTDYIENNYTEEFDFDKHKSVEDIRNFAKKIWRDKMAGTPPYTAPVTEEGWSLTPQTPAYTAQTPVPENSWLTPAYTASVTEPSYSLPLQTFDYTTALSEQSLRTPTFSAPSPLPQQDRQTPSPELVIQRVIEMFSDDSAKKRRRLTAPGANSAEETNKAPPRSKTNNESPMYSSEEDEPDHEREQNRRREEDKNFLRLKALELSKYAGVNERMEKIVQVTRAMQKIYDYCDCKNTINGTPAAAAFVNLLRRLNTYNISHVEMTVNFYELLYPLTLYNDETNRIVSYIFAATNYFLNCAKNFNRMRTEYNKYGPFVQIDSMVMFVIKFNFLCDLQAFFGKIDSLPLRGQPDIKIHTVLVMRDKIVKLAFNTLQYNITRKTDNRRDPKHLQRLIQLMNADFNII
ncbi:P87 [Choristoneura rosaceana nucleopolyhedrovirus]|uniref:p87 n=1 Tax=Choristoneura rosaceana nucleopolyhedrovirus TaxID=58094 RepID=S5MKU7_9ABAC|nr:P87 [Choristoneura rosaceana nucleopolyhedrovirus]AGR57086.1 P87 [Choristoneura rosaceana nucleopolyhedrovirus]